MLNMCQLYGIMLRLPSLLEKSNKAQDYYSALSSSNYYLLILHYLACIISTMHAQWGSVMTLNVDFASCYGHSSVRLVLAPSLLKFMRAIRNHVTHVAFS